MPGVNLCMSVCLCVCMCLEVCCQTIEINNLVGSLHQHTSSAADSAYECLDTRRWSKLVIAQSLILKHVS